MDPAFQTFIAAVASFLVFTLILAFIYTVCSTKTQTRTGPKPNSITPLSSISSSLVDFESATFDPSLERISMESLKAATRGFSPDLIIGDGSFGLVYRATLPSCGVTVAMKRLVPDAFQGFREFRAEMETLGKLRHNNIVKMLGYCVSGADRVLIYEYLENGSLDYWLHDTSSPEGRALSWEVRCKVVKGVANGLEFLHGLNQPIIHRDIKASNVLLDLEFEARIADFGLARAVDGSRSHFSTQVAGTMGYMPPEYRDGMTAATPKADVYSFGVLMLEIATGARPNLPAIVDGKEVGRIQWAREMLARNLHMAMLDSSMPKKGLSEEAVKEYFRIASLCASETRKERPTMSEVVCMLRWFHSSI